MLGANAAITQTFEVAVPLLEEALSRFRQNQDRSGEVAVSGDLAAIVQRQGQLSRARMLILWALDQSDEVDPRQYTWLLNVAASINAFQGRLDEGLECLNKARITAQEPFLTWINIHSATLLDYLGRYDEATAIFNTIGPPFEVGDVVTSALYGYAYTWHALILQDTSTAYAACQEVIHHSPPEYQPTIGYLALATLGVLSRETGEINQATILLQKAEQGLRVHGDYAALLGIRWHQLLVRWHEGECEGVLQVVADILQEMQTQGFCTTLLWQPHRFHEFCIWAQSVGFAHSHMTWLLNTTLAYRSGEPLALAKASVCQPAMKILTAREQEVITLMRAGLRPKVIAERLHISLRTVQNHLQRVYEKLGVQSYNEAIREIEK